MNPYMILYIALLLINCLSIALCITTTISVWKSKLTEAVKVKHRTDYCKYKSTCCGCIIFKDDDENKNL